MNYIKAIDELTGVKERFDRPTEKDWIRIEKELGVELAQDYKELVSLLGAGRFGLDMRLRNPIGTGIEELSRKELVAYRQLVRFQEEIVGISLYPRKGGVILIGGMERQHVMLGPTPEGKNYLQLFILDHDYDQLRRIGVGFARFIYDLYGGKLAERWAIQLRILIWHTVNTFFTPEPSFNSGVVQ
jgi:hypothetical protein